MTDKYLAHENINRAAKALYEASTLIIAGKLSVAFVALEDAFSAVVEAQDLIHETIEDGGVNDER